MLVVWLKRICKNLKNNMIIEIKIILISSIVNITYFPLILTFIYIKITSKWYNSIKKNSIPYRTNSREKHIINNFHSRHFIKFSLEIFTHSRQMQFQPSRNRYNSTESFSNLFVSSIHYYTPYRPFPVFV